MINTGDSNISSGKTYITNNINDTNVERAQLAYSNCTTYIDCKFGLPNKKYESTKLDNDKITEYVEGVIALNGLASGIAETLRHKIKYWFSDWKLSSIKQNDSVFIDSSLSKHEWVAVGVLTCIGVNTFVVSETASEYKLPGINHGDIKCKVEFTDDEGIKLSYKVSEHEIYKYNSYDKGTAEDIKGIINEFCSNVCISATMINGWTDSQDDTMAMSGLIVAEETGYLIVKSKFEHPLFEDTQKVSAYGKYADILGDVARVLGKLSGDNISGFDIQSISKAVNDVFKEIESKYTESQLKNKLVNTVCTIVRLIRSGDIRHIVFFGVPGVNDTIILKVMKMSNCFSLLIVNSDLKNKVELDGIRCVDFNNSIEFNKFMSMIESNNVAKTLAASVESSVHGTIFGKDTPGLYRPGQLDYASCIRLQTTFDEINNWINEDVYLRPGYRTDGNRVTLPNLFKIVMGVKDDECTDMVGSTSENTTPVDKYVDYISRQFNDNSLLFRSFGELENNINNISFRPDNYTVRFKIEGAVNKADYIESQTKLFADGRLNRQAIRASRCYKYSFLSENKQFMILDVIERILTEGYIDYKRYGMTYEQYIDTVLQTTLTMHSSIIDTIHAYNFHGRAPRIIIVSSTDVSSLQNLIRSAIFLCALNLLGFDVLIYVPNSYNNLNSVYTDKFNVDIHVIGDPLVNRELLGTIPSRITSLPVIGISTAESRLSSDVGGGSSVNYKVSTGGFGAKLEAEAPKKKGLLKRLFNL